LENSIKQGLWGWGAAGDINVDRNKPIHTLHNTVTVIDVSRCGAGPHRDHIFGFRHLVVDFTNHRCHSPAHGTGYNHEVRLPWRGTKDTRSIPIHVIP